MVDKTQYVHSVDARLVMLHDMMKYASDNRNLGPTVMLADDEVSITMSLSQWADALAALCWVAHGGPDAQRS